METVTGNHHLTMSAARAGGPRLPHPVRRPVGALAILCGGLIGATDDELPHPAPDALVGLPVLLTGTEHDAWVPVQRVRRTHAVLASAGAVVDERIFPPGPHQVHPEEVDALRSLVRTVAETGAR